MQELQQTFGMIAMVVITTILAGVGAVRKPKFEVKTQASIGASINWFNLPVGESVQFGIRQVYIGVGSMFEELGFRIPDDSGSRTIGLVVFSSQVNWFNSKANEVHTNMTLVTQKVVGDLYESLLESDKFKQISKANLLIPPNDDFDWDDFDTFEGKKNVLCQATIEHVQDPNNSARSQYSLTQFSDNI